MFPTDLSQVQSWNLLIEPLIDKMFAEPSNANIVRFLGHISEHLADAADVVLSCVLMHAKRLKEWVLVVLVFCKDGYKNKKYNKNDELEFMKIMHPYVLLRLKV